METKEKITIRHANITDFERVQLFLKEYWDDGYHIFAENSDYFKYFQVIDGKFNVYLGEGEVSKKIYGICAYVLCNRQEKADIQLNLLRIIENKSGFNSLTLINFMKNDLQTNLLSSCGIRPKTKIIYDYLGYHTGELKHYYRLADKDDYKVAIVRNKDITPVEGGKYTLKYIPNFEQLKECFDVNKYKYLKPYKDEWCINHRYYNSMGHKYKVFGIDKRKEEFDSIIVIREVECNGTKICKIIDFIGLDDDIGELCSAFQDIMDKERYEYIDFYCTGISHEILIKAGFKLRTEDDNNIIPQLFEPFVQENKNIYFFTEDNEGFHMYRGDSDQDRANIL